MRTWFEKKRATPFLSLRGAIVLSIIALVTVVGRTIFVDALFVSEFRNQVPENQPALIALLMLGYMLFVGSWIWALLAASHSSRAGLIVALIFSLLVGLGGGLLTILFFCPGGCAARPVGDSIVWINLVSGLVAAAALGCQFVRSQRKVSGSQVGAEGVQ